MSRKILTNRDFTQNQILNVALQNLAGPPSAPVAGQIYFDTTQNAVLYWNAVAGAWQNIATNSPLLQGQPGAYYLALGNATGSLAASQLPAFSGDVTTSAGSASTTIAPLAVTNAKHAQMPAMTFKVNNTASAATPIDATAAQAKAALAILATDVSGGEATANKGVASGYAGLDASGKVPTAQLPAAVLGGLNYQGTWNASSNSPALVSSTGTKGYYYKVATAGTTSIDGVSSWNLGDSIVFDGTTWDKIDGLTNEIISVAGRTGVVTLAAGDIAGLAVSATTDTTNAANISSGTLATARLPATLVQKYVIPAFGDGSTSSFTITHNLGTQAVTVALYQAASPYAEVDCDVFHTTTNTITLTFGTPSIPTANQYVGVVHG